MATLVALWLTCTLSQPTNSLSGIPPLPTTARWVSGKVPRIRLPAVIDGTDGEDYAYCISRPNQITRSNSHTMPTETPTPVPIPTPIQENNAISNCNRYSQAQSGDWCSKFTERVGISLEQLYAWNAVLAVEQGCDVNFWAGYWYCTGVTILRL